MLGQEFREWRQRMGWSQSQAAHVLLTTKGTVIEWEANRSPIDGRVDHMIESAEMLHMINNGTFTGAPLELLRAFHAKLIERMAEADAMPGRGRPRIVPRADGRYDVVAQDGSDYPLEISNCTAAEADFIANGGMSDEQLKQLGLMPQGAQSAGGMRITPPTRK